MTFFFEKENLITRKIRKINRASPGFGSDSSIGLDRARGSLYDGLLKVRADLEPQFGLLKVSDDLESEVWH